MKFWASFPKIYRFQQAKPIRKLMTRIVLACWNRKIWEKLAQKFHVKLFLCFCRQSCPQLGRWLNANLNGQFVIAIWCFDEVRFSSHSSNLPFHRTGRCTWRAGRFPSSWWSFWVMLRIGYHIYPQCQPSLSSWPVKYSGNCNTPDLHSFMKFLTNFHWPWHKKIACKYWILQQTSHQCSHALADCFRLSWHHKIHVCGQLCSQEQLSMKFWASFPRIYGIQQAKQIRKLTIWIGLACWNWII